MKITKRQLRRIIKEEQQDWRVNQMVDSLVAHLDNPNVMDMDSDEITDWLVKLYDLPNNPPPYGLIDLVLQHSQLTPYWDPLEGLYSAPQGGQSPAVRESKKRRLRRIIREAMPRGGVPDVVGAVTGVYGEKNRRWQDAHARGDLGKNIADADFPIVVGYEGRSEIAYNQEELDDILDDITPGPGSRADIPYSLNSLSDLEPQDVPVGAGIEQYREGKMTEAYGDFARTPEVQAALQMAGFNPDGSFGMDGYPGPGDWQLYSPETMEEAERWIDAAIAMNDALRKAETALDRGEYQRASEAYYEIVYPVQSEYSDTGAADTEGREVAGAWLEQQGFEW